MNTDLTEHQTAVMARQKIKSTKKQSSPKLFRSTQKTHHSRQRGSNSDLTTTQSPEILRSQNRNSEDPLHRRMPSDNDPQMFIQQVSMEDSRPKYLLGIVNENGYNNNYHNSTTMHQDEEQTNLNRQTQKAQAQIVQLLSHQEAEQLNHLASHHKTTTLLEETKQSFANQEQQQNQGGGSVSKQTPTPIQEFQALPVVDSSVLLGDKAKKRPSPAKIHKGGRRNRKSQIFDKAMHGTQTNFIQSGGPSTTKDFNRKQSVENSLNSDDQIRLEKKSDDNASKDSSIQALGSSQRHLKLSLAAATRLTTGPIQIKVQKQARLGAPAETNQKQEPENLSKDFLVLNKMSPKPFYQQRKGILPSQQTQFFQSQSSLKNNQEGVSGFRRGRASSKFFRTGLPQNVYITHETSASVYEQQTNSDIMLPKLNHSYQQDEDSPDMHHLTRGQPSFGGYTQTQNANAFGVNKSQDWQSMDRHSQQIMSKLIQASNPNLSHIDPIQLDKFKTVSSSLVEKANISQNSHEKSSDLVSILARNPSNLSNILDKKLNVPRVQMMKRGQAIKERQRGSRKEEPYFQAATLLENLVQKRPLQGQNQNNDRSPLHQKSSKIMGNQSENTFTELHAIQQNEGNRSAEHLNTQSSQNQHQSDLNLEEYIKEVQQSEEPIEINFQKSVPLNMDHSRNNSSINQEYQLQGENESQKNNELSAEKQAEDTNSPLKPSYIKQQIKTGGQTQSKFADYADFASSQQRQTISAQSEVQDLQEDEMIKSGQFNGMGADGGSSSIYSKSKGGKQIKLVQNSTKNVSLSPKLKKQIQFQNDEQKGDLIDKMNGLRYQSQEISQRRNQTSLLQEQQTKNENNGKSPILTSEITLQNMSAHKTVVDSESKMYFVNSRKLLEHTNLLQRSVYGPKRLEQNRESWFNIEKALFSEKPTKSPSPQNNSIKGSQKQETATKGVELNIINANNSGAELPSPPKISRNQQRGEPRQNKHISSQVSKASLSSVDSKDSAIQNKIDRNSQEMDNLQVQVKQEIKLHRDQSSGADVYENTLQSPGNVQFIVKNQKDKQQESNTQNEFKISVEQKNRGSPMPQIKQEISQLLKTNTFGGSKQHNGTNIVQIRSKLKKTMSNFREQQQFSFRNESPTETIQTTTPKLYLKGRNVSKTRATEQSPLKQDKKRIANQTTYHQQPQILLGNTFTQLLVNDDDDQKTQNKNLMNQSAQQQLVIREESRVQTKHLNDAGSQVVGEWNLQRSSASNSQTDKGEDRERANDDQILRGTGYPAATTNKDPQGQTLSNLIQVEDQGSTSNVNNDAMQESVAEGFSGQMQQATLITATEKEDRLQPVPFPASLLNSFQSLGNETAQSVEALSKNLNQEYSDKSIESTSERLLLADGNQQQNDAMRQHQQYQHRRYNKANNGEQMQRSWGVLTTSNTQFSVLNRDQKQQVYQQGYTRQAQQNERYYQQKSKQEIMLQNQEKKRNLTLYQSTHMLPSQESNLNAKRIKLSSSVNELGSLHRSQIEQDSRLKNAPEGIAHFLRQSIEHNLKLKKGIYDRKRDRNLFNKAIDEANGYKSQSLVRMSTLKPQKHFASYQQVLSRQDSSQNGLASQQSFTDLQHEDSLDHENSVQINSSEINIGSQNSFAIKKRLQPEIRRSLSRFLETDGVDKNRVYRERRDRVFEVQLKEALKQTSAVDLNHFNRGLPIGRQSKQNVQKSLNTIQQKDPKRLTQHQNVIRHSKGKMLDRLKQIKNLAQPVAPEYHQAAIERVVRLMGKEDEANNLQSWVPNNNISASFQTAFEQSSKHSTLAHSQYQNLAIPEARQVQKGLHQSFDCFEDIRSFDNRSRLLLGIRQQTEQHPEVAFKYNMLDDQVKRHQERMQFAREDNLQNLHTLHTSESNNFQNRHNAKVFSSQKFQVGLGQIGSDFKGSRTKDLHQFSVSKFQKALDETQQNEPLSFDQQLWSKENKGIQGAKIGANKDFTRSIYSKVSRHFPDQYTLNKSSGNFKKKSLSMLESERESNRSSGMTNSLTVSIRQQIERKEGGEGAKKDVETDRDLKSSHLQEVKL